MGSTIALLRHHQPLGSTASALQQRLSRPSVSEPHVGSRSILPTSDKPSDLVGHGDEVIVPSHTYIASATCINLVGATPKFVEVEEEYYTLDPTALEAAITSSTKAIIGVHLVWTTDGYSHFR